MGKIKGGPKYADADMKEVSYANLWNFCCAIQFSRLSSWLQIYFMTHMNEATE